jgi:hypothetical protein
MNPFCRNSAILLLCAIVMGACAAPSTETLVQNNSAAAAVLPVNYRALIARYILTHERLLQGIVVNTAMISKPYDDRGAPLFRNIAPDHLAAVCVAFDSRSLLGTHRGYLLFTIRNGQVERIYTHNNAILFTEGMCPDYTPFRELISG